MNKYKHYQITIKETGTDKPITTEYHGNIDEQGLVAFFGLENPDVEWYKIEELCR